MDFSDSESTGEYVPLAERIRREEMKTPDRFRRDPVLRESNHDKWAQRRKATVPKSPRFAKSSKHSRLQEMREEKHGKKKRERKVSGAPNLRTSQRAKYHEAPQAEQFNTEFKARPMPKMTGRPLRSANSSRASLQSTTKQDPFSFDSRPSRKKTPVVEPPKMSLKHAPGALPESLDRAGPLPPRTTKTVTKPKAFDFATQSRSQSRMFSFSNVTAGKMEFGGKKSSEAFMKKALKGHSAVVPEQREATVPKTPTLALNRRGQERKEYDAKIKEAEKAAEEAAQAEQAMQAKIDAEEVKELRQTLVHKAAPIRDNYAPVPAKNTQQATLPITPKFGGPRTRSRTRTCHK